MNGLHIGSTGGCAGKTLLALALGQSFERQGRRIGFIKPVDAPPPRPGDPDILDSAFVRESLGLSDPLSRMSPVVLPRPSWAKDTGLRVCVQLGGQKSL